MRQRLGWLAWVSPRDWVMGRPCMMTPWVWWCALGWSGRVLGYGSRWVISSITTSGWSSLDVVAGVVDRHQVGGARQRHPVLLALVPRLGEACHLGCGHVGQVAIGRGDDGQRQRAERDDARRPRRRRRRRRGVRCCRSAGRRRCSWLACIAAMSEPSSATEQSGGRPGGRGGVDEDEPGDLVGEE